MSHEPTPNYAGEWVTLAAKVRTRASSTDVVPSMAVHGGIEERSVPLRVTIDAHTVLHTTQHRTSHRCVFSGPACEAVQQDQTRSSAARKWLLVWSILLGKSTATPELHYIFDGYNKMNVMLFFTGGVSRDSGTDSGQLK